MARQLLSGRLAVTLDDGKTNRGRIIHSNCSGCRALMVPRPVVDTPVGEDSPPVPEQEYYDHIVFVESMSGPINIGGTVYVGMSECAILAVIPDE